MVMSACSEVYRELSHGFEVEHSFHFLVFKINVRLIRAVSQE